MAAHTLARRPLPPVRSTHALATGLVPRGPVPTPRRITLYPGRRPGAVTQSAQVRASWQGGHERCGAGSEAAAISPGGAGRAVIAVVAAPSVRHIRGRRGAGLRLVTAAGVCVPLMVGLVTGRAAESRLVALGAFYVGVIAPQGAQGARARSMIIRVAVVALFSWLGGLVSGHDWLMVVVVSAVAALGAAPSRHPRPARSTWCPPSISRSHAGRTTPHCAACWTPSHPAAPCSSRATISPTYHQTTNSISTLESSTSPTTSPGSWTTPGPF